jgi:hypothetical protein
MATTQSVTTITVPANADLSTKQFYCGSINSSGRVAVTGDGARCDGLIQNKPSAAGEPTELAVEGLAKGIAGGAINPGVEVASDGNGKLVTAIAADYVVGVYLGTAAAADGQFISVLMTKYQKNP